MVWNKPIGVAYSDPQLNGAIIGDASTATPAGTVGFYGTTPVTKGTAVTTLATTPTATDIATAVNSIINRLQRVGLIA